MNEVIRCMDANVIYLTIEMTRHKMPGRCYDYEWNNDTQFVPAARTA